VPGERMAEIRKQGSEVEVPLLLALTGDNVCPPGAFAVLKRPVTPAHLVEVLQLAEGLVERARATDEGIMTVPLIESLDPGGRLRPDSSGGRLRPRLGAPPWGLFQEPVAVTVLDDRRDSIYSYLPSRGFSTRLASAELAAAFRSNPPAVFVELSPAEQSAMA